MKLSNIIEREIQYRVLARNTNGFIETVHNEIYVMCSKI